MIPNFTLADYYGRLWLCESMAFAGYHREIETRKLELHSSMQAGSPMVLRDGVAVISLTGLLTKGRSYLGTSTMQARADLKTARQDPNVKGIVLAIQSPGGETYGVYDLGQDIYETRQKYKPVIAHIDDLGASAAYWAASQASAIYANNAMAEVGSIGVTHVVEDWSEAAAKAGVKVHVFKYPEGSVKGAGIHGSVISEEQQAYFQSRVNTVGEEFSAAIKRGRHLSEAALGKVTTGAVFPSKQALELKLIDGIRPLEQSIRAARVK